MEDPNREDSQDSETSSLGSWILLSNDEVAADLASVELNVNSTVNSLNEAVLRLTDVDLKNNESEIESDGISIISESEYSQSSGSDDDNESAAVSNFENYEGNEDILVKTGQLFKQEMKNSEEQYENLSKIEMGSKGDFKNKCKTEKASINLEEGEVLDVELNEELYTLQKYTKNEDIENSLPKIIEETLKDQVPICNCLDNVIRKYELKKMVTWPSFLCTSVVIFAVLVFPYFSSNIDNTNTLDQPDMEEYEEHSLTAKNMAVVDPLVYCMEIHRSENLYRDNNMKRCVKKILKQMRKLRSNNIAEFHSSEKKIDENQNNNNWNEHNKIDTFWIKQKYFHKNDKKHKNKKRYDNFIPHDSEKFKRISEKNENFPVNEISTANNVDISSGENINSYQKDYTFIQNLLNENEKLIAEYWSSQQIQESNDIKNFENSFGIEQLLKLEKLNEMKNSLLKKENLLREWEEHLTRRELTIQKNMKQSYDKKDEHENNCGKKNKFGKSRNQKGDFDKDGDLPERKFKKSKKTKNHEFISTEEQKNHVKHFESLDERNHGQIVLEQPNEDDTENWKKNKKFLRMKAVFHNKNLRKIKEKTEAPSRPLWQNINREPSNKVNAKSDHKNAKYLRMQSIVKKNRTRIFGDDNITVSGDWYLNLVQGRHDIRKKEDKAVWWFDRVEFRKNKRNKAFWYFQYMLNRENLRYRPRNI